MPGFLFSKAGHAICIIDSGADHADLTDEYAAIPGELKRVSAYFGKDVLRDIPEADFFAALPKLRRQIPDRLSYGPSTSIRPEGGTRVK